MNSALPLAGQVAVVTGGSGGIGRGILAALRNAGAKVFCLDLVPPPAADGVTWLKCDVREEASVACWALSLNLKKSRGPCSISAVGRAGGLRVKSCEWTAANSWEVRERTEVNHGTRTRG